MRYIVFQAVGIGPFPLDMLRYEGCFPLTQVDVRIIAESLDIPTTRNVVTLVKPVDSKKQKVCKERWESFGWTVTNIERR